MAKKLLPPPHLRLASPEGIGYIAWERDPLYQLKPVIEEAGFNADETILPLTVLLAEDPQACDFDSLLRENRQGRKNLTRQLQQYGSKLSLQEAITFIGRLRSLILQSFLLEALRHGRDGGTDSDQEGEPRSPGTDEEVRRGLATQQAAAGRPSRNGPHAD